MRAQFRNGSKNKKVCKWNWDNSCKSQEECCSGFCDNNDGKWRYGICKPKPQEVTEPTTDDNSSTECKPDWNDSCQVDDDCCSNICHKRSGGWMYGLCKPKPTTTIATTTTTTPESVEFDETNCRADWYDRCTTDKECCSKNCFGNNGLWPVGVCKPLPRTTTTSTESTITSTILTSTLANGIPTDITESAGSTTTEMTSTTIRTVTAASTTERLLTTSVAERPTTTRTTTTKSTTTEAEIFCNPDWFDRCTKNEECCSKNCYDNNGKWPSGICKPGIFKFGFRILFWLWVLADFLFFLGEPPMEDHEETEEEAKINYRDYRCNKVFTDRMIELHNEYRQWHQAQNLNLNEKLSSIAKSYTEMLSRQDVGLFHSRNRHWGENLAQVQGGDCKGKICKGKLETVW